MTSTPALAGVPWQEPHFPSSATPRTRPWSFQSTAIVRYAVASDRPHRLVLTCAPPDRTRWQLEAGEGPSRERQIRFRSGDRLYALEPRSPASVELTGTDRIQAMAQIELRQALVTWPDGLAWKGSGVEREANLGSRGTLRARLARATDSHPVEIGYLDAEGRQQDTYSKIVWREIEGRSWPASAEMWHAGVQVWCETLESATTRARFLDSFFIPPDRVTNTAGETARTQIVDIPAVCGRRFELTYSRPEPEPADATEATSWESAIVEIDALHADWAAQLHERGLALEPKATVELDDALRPRSCILRLTQVPQVLPAGFTTAPVRKAAAVALRSLDQISSHHLNILIASAPQGADRRDAYVRFDLGQPTVGQALIVLPFPAQTK